MTRSHCTGSIQSGAGVGNGKKVALGADQKTHVKGVEVMWFGKVLHIRAEETGKARSPMVKVKVKVLYSC